MSTTTTEDPPRRPRKGGTGQPGRHSYADRQHDLYETPRIAIETLLKVEELPHRIWEPAAGKGAIVRVLREHGHFVVTGDIVDYGFPLDHIGDFLEQTEVPAGCGAVLTNPPFRIAGQFAEHALRLCPRVFLFLRLTFMESGLPGFGEGRRHLRSRILEGGQLARVHVFRDRLHGMHRDGWTGKKTSPQSSYAWFVWSRDHHGPTTIHRI